MPSPDPTAKIYLTYKTRMLSEALAKSHARFYSALIPWYSFVLVAFSIAQGFGYYSGKDEGLLFAIASVGIFGLSLYINGRELWQRADDFRSCYLKLSRIYESEQTTPEKMAAYNQVLGDFENQTDADFDEMVFDAWLRGQSLSNSRGPVSPTFTTGLKIVLQKVWRYSTRVVLVIAPLVLAWQILGYPESPSKEPDLPSRADEPTTPAT